MKEANFGEIMVRRERYTPLDLHSKKEWRSSAYPCWSMYLAIQHWYSVVQVCKVYVEELVDLKGSGK